jgi:hypothetical protein
MKKSAFILLIILSALAVYTQDKPVIDEEATIILPRKDSEIDIPLPSSKDNNAIKKSGEQTDNSSGSASKLNNDTEDGSEAETRSNSDVYPDNNSDSITDNRSDSGTGMLITADKRSRVYSDGINTFINRYVLFTLASSDNIFKDKIYYKINNGSESLYEKPFTIETEGTHRISYYSVDLLGNREPDENELTVIQDSTPPEIAVSSNLKLINDRYYMMKDTSFTASAADKSSGVQRIEFSLNGGPYKRIVSVFPDSLNTDKLENFSIKFRAFDNVGNVTENFSLLIPGRGGAELRVSGLSNIPLYIDRTPPVVKITPELEFFYNEASKITTTANRYTITAEDAGTGVKDIYFRITGSEYFVKYTEPVTLKSGGEKRIEAYAEDLDGNKSALVDINFYIDLKPPVSELKIITD